MIGDSCQFQMKAIRQNKDCCGYSNKLKYKACQIKFDLSKAVSGF